MALKTCHHCHIGSGKIYFSMLSGDHINKKIPADRDLEIRNFSTSYLVKVLSVFSVAMLVFLAATTWAGVISANLWSNLYGLLFHCCSS